MERQFKGSGLLFLKNVSLYLLLMGPLVSACFMGGAWAHLYLSILVLSLAALPPMAFFVDRTDGFSFDDERQAVRKPAGKDIPYSRMQRLDVRETSGLLRITVKTDRLTSVALVTALPGSEKNRLFEELKKRAPHLVIRERKNADWKSLLLIGTVIVIAAGGFHGYMYSRHPQIKALPRQLTEMKSDATRAGTSLHRVGDFDLLLPKRFNLLKTDGATAYFEDPVRRTQLKAIAVPRKEEGNAGRKALRLATGMEDYAGILERAYPARIGVIPLLLKDMSLEGMEDVLIFEARNDSLKGYITQGKREGRELTHIALVERTGGAMLSIFVSGPSRWEEPSLQRIVSGIRVRRE